MISDRLLRSRWQFYSFQKLDDTDVTGHRQIGIAGYPGGQCLTPGPLQGHPGALRGSPQVLAAQRPVCHWIFERCALTPVGRGNRQGSSHPATLGTAMLMSPLATGKAAMRRSPPRCHDETQTFARHARVYRHHQWPGGRLCPGRGDAAISFCTSYLIEQRVRLRTTCD